ncbi:hypothetical protein WUBG_05698 [Wuchereria bancrofti]|uniref:Uncharacterized protein n=1 Tax=Wuchereria bancrofti TaxID=6293 RepID=J9F1R4_WUCBA|nr:hypothetical protein WUBG_05698 [Wuchereria bancrofti]
MVGEDLMDINKLPPTFADKVVSSSSDGKFHLPVQILMFVLENFNQEICYFILFAENKFRILNVVLWIFTDESVGMERWAADVSSDELQAIHLDEQIRFRELEEEQERLNSSLLSLSTHFAQVQFRLKQISKADPLERDVIQFHSWMQIL